MTSDVDQRRSHGSPAGPATLEKVAGLRWREPRLAAELAQEVLGEAAERGEAGNWLRAAGWLLYGRSAVGDARETALDLLADIDTRAGRDVLRRPEAGRLRVELAALAQANGDPDIARDLLDGWQPAGPDGGGEQDELELDRLAVLVRCALVDGSDELPALRADVEALSERLDGEPEALAELLLGSVHRDDGEPAAAAERALRGLARLGWTPADPASPPRSPHLGCALLSQWATALLEDGASADIPDGVKQLEVGDGGRHGVLWRLAVARAFAGRARPTADVLEDAASSAAAVDAPSLEAACRSAQAELYEGAGRFQDALVAVRAAMEAERTDRERAERLREALSGPAAALAGDLAADPAERSAYDDGAPEFDRPSSDGDLADRPSRPDTSIPVSDVDATGGPVDADVAGPAMATLDIGLDGFDGAAGQEPIDGRIPDDPGTVVADRDGDSSRGPSPDRGAPLEPDGARRARDGLDDPEPATDGPGRPEHGEPGTLEGASAAVDVSWQLPGSRGVDATSGDGEGSPLADALLAELRDAVGDAPRSTRSTAAAPSRAAAETGEPDGAETGVDSEPDDEPRAPTIVLELVGSDGRTVRHRDTDAVGTDLASRAERLLPQGADVRGPVDVENRAVADSVVEVVVPGAEGVALRLWARSLVGHLASRVSRRGLPDGTVVRAQVHASGGAVGDAEEQALNGPSTPDRPRPRPRPAAEAETTRRTDDLAGTEQGTSAHLDVRPGSGGRRRKATVDEPASPSARWEGADGVAPVNGASVDHLRRDGVAKVEPGRPGATEDSAEPPALGRRARRRRAEGAESDTRPGDVNGASVINGKVRPHRDDAAGPNEGGDESHPIGDGAADAEAAGRRSPDGSPTLNGHRPSRAEARRAATALPGAETADDSAQADGVARAADDVAPADGDATSAGPTDGTVRADGGPTADDAAWRDDGGARTGRTAEADGTPPGNDAPQSDGRVQAGRGVQAGSGPWADGAAGTDVGGVQAGGTAQTGDGRDDARGKRARGSDAGADAWSIRRPDPLDTSVPVEDVVPDGAVWLKGAWVVPGPVEQATVDSVQNGAQPVSRLTNGVEPPTVRDDVPPPTGVVGLGSEPTNPTTEPAATGPDQADTGGSHRTGRRSSAAAEVDAAADGRSPSDALSGAGSDSAGRGGHDVSWPGSAERRTGSRHASGAEGVEGVEGEAAGADRADPGRESATGRHTGPGRASDLGQEPGAGAGSRTVPQADTARESSTTTGPVTDFEGDSGTERAVEQATGAEQDADLGRAVGAGPGTEHGTGGERVAAAGRTDDTGRGSEAAPEVGLERAAGSGDPAGAGRSSNAGRTSDTARVADSPQQADTAQETGPVGSSHVGRGTGTDSGQDSGPGPDDAPATPDGTTARREPAAGSSSRRDRRARGERRSGRGGRGRDVPATGGDPTAIPDDLGLGDLLAGALAAYRDTEL